MPLPGSSLLENSGSLIVGRPRGSSGLVCRDVYSENPLGLGDEWEPD